MTNLIEGRPAKNMLSAAVLALLGAVGFYLSTWGDWTLAYRNFVLPSWSMQILGLVAFLVGLWLLIFGKETICALCGHGMHMNTTRFKPEEKEALLKTLQERRFLDIFCMNWVGVGNAETYSWSPNGHLDVEFNLCSNCVQSGYLTLEELDGTKTTKLARYEFTEDEARSLERQMEEHFPSAH